MGEEKPRKYDLEERTLQFAKRVAGFTKEVVKDIPNVEYSKQVIRSSGSVGANYIEANESLSKRDFAMRIKICRKEAKETRFWLQLMTCADSNNLEKEQLIQESTELLKIFSAILSKSS